MYSRGLLEMDTTIDIAPPDNKDSVLGCHSIFGFRSASKLYPGYSVPSDNECKVKYSEAKDTNGQLGFLRYLYIDRREQHRHARAFDPQYPQKYDP